MCLLVVTLLNMVAYTMYVTIHRIYDAAIIAFRVILFKYFTENGIFYTLYLVVSLMHRFSYFTPIFAIQFDS